MTERIEKLYKQIRVKKFPFCVDKAKLFTEGFKKYDGEPGVLRMAYAQAYMLDHIPIWMFKGDLIAGAPCSKPMGVEADFWTKGVWEPEGIESLRKENEWIIDDETAAEMYELSDYWRGKIPAKQQFDLFDDDMWNWRCSGFELPKCSKNSNEAAGSGYAVNGMEILPEADVYNLDYKYILSKGLNAIIEDCKNYLKNTPTMSIENDEDIDRIHNLRAMIIIDEAVIRWAARYATLAEELAEKCESEQRKKELYSIAETCRRIPGEPAVTFQDAITFQWLVFLMTASQTTAPVGRADQYLYPYYKHDKELGLIDDEMVLEYLQCYRLKMMQMKNTSGGSSRLKWQGQARWNGITIGGVKPDGTDATNPLTYLFIEAANRLRTPLPSLIMRVHKETPKELMQKALELMRTGIGFPAFVSDDSYVSNLLLKEVPLEKARDYHILGCIDCAGPEIGGHAFRLLIQTIPLDTFLHNGYSKHQDFHVMDMDYDVYAIEEYTTFVDKLMEHTKWYFDRIAKEMLLWFLTYRKTFQDPFTSSIYSDGPSSGKLWKYRPLPYKVGPTLSMGVGIINFCQSVYVIKKLVFDEKKLTLKELVDALDDNWQSERSQQIRRMCLELPQYGNNIDEVDNVVVDLYNKIIDLVTDIDSYRGVKYTVAAISITSHDPGGRITGATPDGRYAGTILADACASPIQGRDTEGLLSVLNSARKLPAVRMQSLLLNQKIHPTALKSDADLEKLGMMIKAFLNNGGKQVQFNVVNNEDLIKAQENPEEYRDLVVRVAGFSTYFTLLGKPMQDEIISRTAHEAV